MFSAQSTIGGIDSDSAGNKLTLEEDYREALERYQGYRDAAYALTWEELRHEVPSGCDLKVMPIGQSALVYWSAIRDIGFVNKRGNFDWGAIYQQVRNCPKRFDVAIWDGHTLCGMACGMASKGSSFVTVKWLERFRTDEATSGLRGLVAEIALTSADHYAAIIERKTVRLKNPLPGTEMLYSTLGFRSVDKDGRNVYLNRDVQNQTD